MSNVGRDAKRAAKSAKVLYQHPRCVICSDPIVMKPGRNHRSRTCGKRPCVKARSNWMREYRKPVGRRICPECEKPVPAERNANSIYCSRKCNTLRNGRINTRRFRQRQRAA